MTDTPKPLTSAELADLKAKAKAATPGPWIVCRTRGDRSVVYGWHIAGKEHGSAYPIADHRYEGEPLTSQQNANGDHIAAANPETILRLLAMIERLQSADMKREIENAAYERAAKEADDCAKHADQFGNYSSTYYQGFDDGADEAALAIRSLITPAKAADTEG